MDLDGRHVLKFELRSMISYWISEWHATHLYLLLAFRFLVRMLRFSKFFGPSPRKHRLTVYRGFQVLLHESGAKHFPLELGFRLPKRRNPKDW